MRRPWSLILLAVPPAALLWLACTGDDATLAPPIPDGELGGACFRDGTCLASLKCVRNLCEAAGDAEAGGDGGTRDGAVDATGASDAAPDVEPKPCMLASPDASPFVHCKEATCNSAGETCCRNTSDQCLVDPANCGATDVPWTCEQKDHCSGGKLCCADLVLTDASCPSSTVDVRTSYCAVGTGGGACPANTVRLCATGETCPSGTTCLPLVVNPTQYDGGRFTVGACLAP